MDKGTDVSFDVLFSNASMGILVSNERGEIVLVNPFLLKQFQYTEAELLGAPLEKLIPGRFHNRHTQHVRNYNEHPKNRPMGLEMDLFAVRKNGQEFPVEVSLGNYETEKGKFAIAFLTDISRRKEAEASLQQLNEELEEKIEERTRSLTSTVTQLAGLIAETEAKDVELNRINAFLNNVWDHAGAIIFVTDKQGVITMFNPAAERHLGYAAAEIISRETPFVFHYREAAAEEEPGLFAKADLNLLNECEFLYIRKNQSLFPVSLTMTAMRNTGGEIDGYLGIAIDISERKKAETDLRLALDKEKELSELKLRFVSIASHEFRTPLSTVLSSAYLISKYKEAADHPKREKHVQRIVSSVNTLTDILNDFLSVGRIEEGRIQVRPVVFNVEQHIRNVIGELNGVLKKGQRILYTHAGDPDMFMDAGLLKHIVMNLLSNALKFSPENTTVTLRSEKNEQHFCLVCKDEGLGISPEDQQHLFERFFRGTNVTNIQGTGLGLHIISKYAELMNGVVSCQSALNAGTTFEILFPVQYPQ